MKTEKMTWWRQAKFGLFIHYGLYSQLGKGEWVQFNEKLPLAEYEKLRDSFRAEKFDADFITDLACEAEMKYVNLVTCHHDSFCLWNSKVEPFNSVNSPCGRDLVGELAAACAKKNLGFFTYYTYHLNWRHPKFIPRSLFAMARPDYPQPEPRYTYQLPADFREYVDYVHAALTELLTGYGPLAGVWLDLIAGHYALPDLMPVRETYALIRRLQPEALVAFKQGATGDEDFATPERHFHSMAETARSRYGERAAQVAAAAWEKNQHKHNEICATLQDGWWGYGTDARHIGPDEVWRLLGHAAAHNCNLLLNTGPLPDGSIHPADIATLRAVGKRIRQEGWPAAMTETIAATEITPE
ncbi:MAG: alpha-L-fucosidase [Spartobacteria bacterium]